MNFAAKITKQVLYIVTVMLMCLFCAIGFTACNGKEKESVVREREYTLYYGGIYFGDDGVAYAFATMSGKEENKLVTTLKWVSKTYEYNTWFKQEDVSMTVNSKALYADMDGFLTQEQRTHDGVYYDDLKVVVRYDTIYKSIRSDAEIVKVGKNYTHRFKTDKTLEAQEFNLAMKTQNTANWYTMLIASVIIFGVALTGAALAIKGKLWQKKTKKSE